MSISRQNLSVVIVTFMSEDVIHNCIKSIPEEINIIIVDNLKNLGLGILLILPFSPITLPYVFSKAKELDIDLIPNWYKSLSNDNDRLE